MLPPCKDFEKIPARQLLALRACTMATDFFRYLYIGGYGGGTDINRPGIGAVFGFVSETIGADYPFNDWIRYRLL